ncbi:FtsK/SpoIIIE domain-containing protein [Rossellomorea sp. y25]|uniref:FtsK/SpoIIIE domain-containing protein n=1 Tax=Rossellomorea sp. y25 TaxID=3118174 RepID=UPI0030E49677
MITYNDILGKWVFHILMEHFKEQSLEGTNKLFIKVNGLTDNNVHSLLKELDDKASKLEKFYSPNIRTIKPVRGFDQYKLKEIETSTWLRNYTFSGHALVIIINELTPEAQSLENLFAIDEAYLLSDFGLESLFSLLSEEFQLAAEEIETLKEFFTMYSSLTDPQLRFILRFVEKIVNQESPSIIEKIRTNLPELNLFRDQNLIIGAKGKKRLRSNFLLANLQKPNGDLDTEKLQNNLYTFIEAEEKNNFSDELWNGINPAEFEKKVIDFLNQKNLDLLTYDFNVVETVLNFKTKTTLPDKIRDALILNGNPTKDEIDKIEEGINEVEKNQNPDAMQDFLEEFEDELSQSAKLDKVISRRIEKLRHPKDYHDLINALQYETFSLIEENSDKVNKDSFFELTVYASKITTEMVETLHIYLNDISKVVPHIKFKERSLASITVDETTNNELSFKLHLMNDNETLGTETFKVRGFENLQLLSFKDEIEKLKIPHLKNYQEDEIEMLDVREMVHERVDGYLSIKQPGFEEHYNRFSGFLEEYSITIRNIMKFGVFSIDISKFKRELESVLSGVAASVDVASHIYRFINYIGSIDTLDVKLGQQGFCDERIVTILNPIRLVSYVSRYEKLDNQITDWIERSIKGDLEVVNIEDYLEYVTEKTLNLAPRYFSSDGDDSFLIEVSEILGEGQFILNTKRSENMDYLSNELSEELVKSVKNYFEVYPYAKDGLDILFLYCQSADIITKSIDALFSKHKNLNKLKITVHSTQAANIHQKINQWIKQKEEYTNPDRFSKFPTVEVKVISGSTINEISNQINAHMIDADLVVLADYFGQSNQVKYEFDKIEAKQSNDWFNLVYKEPLLETESLKRISYVSEHLPDTLKSFYQLQYIFQKKEMLEEDELYVLKNKISLSNFSDNALIDYMHENFNWIMFMDRYLDKSLLEKASSKAQIIQYKSKAGANKNFKLIVSSSEYIKKLNSNKHDYEYYDRLTKKLSLILKNGNIQKENVKEAVNRVKSISGALVLKAIGPGKYSHELVATYLSMNRRSKLEHDLQVWSVCDELPWFRKNNRRPDLVITTIKENDGNISLDFELLELKFVNQAIFERERYDAIKQIQSGKNLYENLFDFNQDKADAEYWRSELIHYFIEKGTYAPEKAYLLKRLQNAQIDEIQVNIHSSIDAYCYTSNLYQNSFEAIEEDVYMDLIEGEHKNYIFNRAYILKSLGATTINEPIYEELENHTDSFSDSLILEDESKEQTKDEEGGSPPNNEGEDALGETDGDSNPPGPNSEEGESVGNDGSGHGQENDSDLEGDEEEVDREFRGGEKVNPPLPGDSNSDGYPEVIALKDLKIEHETEQIDHSELKRKYVSTLETHFNRNGLNVKVQDVVVGSSVVRLTLSLPSSLNSDKILRRKKDIQIWLGLDQEPNLFIDKHGLNIDIVREDPDTIYFEEFMAIARKQLNDTIKRSNLVAPLGFDPLNNVINIDLSDPSTPHLLTGGTTGSGKSVTLNSIILGTMCFYEPSQLQYVFIDPKQVEFSIYEDLPHTQDVVTSIDDAVVKLNMLVEEMERRYGLFKDEFASNLDEYIDATQNRLPRIVCVFDEFADFMSQEKEVASQVENAILRLGQKARAAGIHLIICTQNPKSDIINTNIRNNLGARLALRATDSTASSVILGESGAENLGGKGDFLAKTASQKVTRGKSPFLTPQVKRALLKYFKATQ